jgi:hypothetical protein
MIVFRVWKDAIKDNWQDAITEAEAIQLDFGFGFDELELNQWNKEAHLAEINALHEAEFEKRVLKAGYKQDLKEFERTLADTRSQWHEEAKAINAYWLNGEITINNYAETVTEETAQDPIVFVSSI